MQLLDGLIAKITKEGEEEHKLFEDFTKYCHDDSMDLQFQIETGKSDVERAKANIAAEEAKIEELSTTISTATADLASATEIREKENADFVKLEKELMEAVSMLER